MKDETKRLIGLLWASKGHMIVGGVVGRHCRNCICNARSILGRSTCYACWLGQN